MVKYDWIRDMSNDNKVANPRPYSFTCKRCGHEWSGFVAEPKICGNRKCRSYYWNLEGQTLCAPRTRVKPQSSDEERLAKMRDSYYRRKESGRLAASNQKWREGNAEERAQYKREYNARPEVQERRRELQREAWKLVPAEKKKERNRRWLIRRYGMQPEDFDAMMKNQNSGCAICRVTLDLKSKDTALRPHIDHDHALGHVRGILCGRCNSGIGQFQDRSGLLREAADYLDRTIIIPCESPLAEAVA